MNNEEKLDNIVVLNDETGNDVKFEFLDLIEYEGEEYVVLLPTDDENDGEVVILKIAEAQEDEESYVSVDSKETLNEVYRIFKEKFKDEFNFEEEM